MSKVACSSILLALSQMRRDTNFVLPTARLEDGSASVHAFQDAYTQAEFFLHRWPVAWPPLPKSLIKFTFTRNPYARFRSFYKSKILGQQLPGPYYRRFGITAETSFEECVASITSVDPADLEHHSAPQSLIAFNGDELLVDFVGKLETIDRDWTVIQALTGYDIQLDHTNAFDDSEGIYTASTAQRIYEYYRDDFELFGYSESDVTLVGNGQSVTTETEPYKTHLVDIIRAPRLKARIESTSAAVAEKAASFRATPGIRDEFYASQQEMANELILKRIAAVEEEFSKSKRQTNNIESKPSLVRSEPRADSLEELKRELFELNDIVAQSGKSLVTMHDEVPLIKSELDIVRGKFERLIGLIFNLEYSRARKSPLSIAVKWLKFRCLHEAAFIRRHNLIKADYYFSQYPVALACGIDAAEHYVQEGAGSGFNPTPEFNTYEYMSRNGEVLACGINPLVHAKITGKLSPAKKHTT